MSKPATLPKWEPWEPGYTGKGIMTPLGRVYAWRTSEIDDFERSHAAAVQRLRIPADMLYSDSAAAFLIDEHGAVHIHYTDGAHNLDNVLAAHPDWHADDGSVEERYYS